MIQLKEISISLNDIARDTGAFIKGELGKVQASDIEEKEMNSLVSYVDKQAERMIVSALDKLNITNNFITEEETVDREASSDNYRWVIDPLDGTTNFLKGIPHFSVSISLEQDKNPIVGVVEDIMQRDTYWAYKGSGAFCNERPIQVSKTKTMNEVIIATGFPYIKNDKSYSVTSAFDILKHWITEARGIRRLGSAALDLAFIASGKLDAYYESNLNRWDLSAGALIVQEAGGIVSDFKNESNHLSSGNIIAANKIIHPEVLKVIDLYLT